MSGQAWRYKQPQEDDGDSTDRDVARARRREDKLTCHPTVTRRRRTLPEPPPSPDYHSMVAARLEAGRIEYGDKSAQTKSLMRLAMEIREEFADVGGWGRIFRDRCELMGIEIPPKIERHLEALDVAAIAGFAVLDELDQWARGVERGE